MGSTTSFAFMYRQRLAKLLKPICFTNGDGTSVEKDRTLDTESIVGTITKQAEKNRRVILV